MIALSDDALIRMTTEICGLIMALGFFYFYFQRYQ
jgi:hypothetical protein